MAYCMVTAYATQRTFVLESKGWEYAKDGWETGFLPLSETCTEGENGTYVDDFEKDGSAYWEMTEEQKKAKGLDDQVIRLRWAWKTKLKKNPVFAPMSIPEDLVPLLTRLPGDPYVRWIGEIITYILRPQHWLQDYIERENGDIDFERPIVGLHVRRTDKWTEAKLRGIEEYIDHAEEFYRRIDMERPDDARAARRVYLATDEPKLLSEAMEKYPNYEFVGGNASFPRRSGNSLQGIVKDIYLLSRTNCIVCTFSSNVCRLVYVLMQHGHPEKAVDVRSLDDAYHVHLQNPSELTAIYSHHSGHGTNEIELKRGDIIVQQPMIKKRNHGWFSEGTNSRTGSNGMFPSYKAKSKVKLVKMPTYDGIDD